MISPILIPFKADHLRAFEDRDKWQHSGHLLALHKELGGPAFTGILGSEILGCAGIMIPWPGVGLAWVTMSASAIQHSMWITRTVRRVVQDIVRGCQLHRLEAVVLEDNVVNQRWIELLGFHREENGVAQWYDSDKRNAVRYERVIDG